MKEENEMIKSVLDVTTTPILKGLEKINKIDILENGVISIQYSITDEFMKENELYYKDRILQLDPNQTNENLRVRDFANVMKGI